MAYLSQFIRYSSDDANFPVLSGTSGSLLNLFTQCLVTGYGDKPGAGWLKLYGDTNNCGIFQQPTGSGLYLVVYDNASGSSGTTKECFFNGYESITSFTSGAVTGVNPFPTPSQVSLAALNTRKSVTADTSSRAWIMYADSSSFYFFANTGDATSTYFAMSFGDIYSFSSSDQYKCMIVGRVTANTPTSTTENLDKLSAINTATTGHFIARSYTGTGTSTTYSVNGDSAKGSSTVLAGNITAPNSPDNSYYLSPVWVCENSNSAVRGMMRGFYQICHPQASSFLIDGLDFSGSGEFAGKTFEIINKSGNTGVYCIETSNTLLTN